MDDLDAVGLEVRQVRLRVAARRFDDLHAAFDDGVPVLVIGNRVDRRQDGHVHAERLVGHLPAALDFLQQPLGSGKHVRGDEAERAGIGHGCDQIGIADPGHAAHDDRMLDAEHLRDSGLDHDCAVTPCV